MDIGRRRIRGRRPDGPGIRRAHVAGAVPDVRRVTVARLPGQGTRVLR